MNNQLIELDASGLQEINGGIPWGGLTIWGGALFVASNWPEIKKGIADGWHDAWEVGLP